jgi:NarL family two-component system response regulator LiaR
VFSSDSAIPLENLSGRNGRVALDEILEIRPDVVILDIVMPEMNALEAAYRIRQLTPETKVILMSSYYSDERAVTLNRLFGDGNFMPKSEIATELVSAISRLLSASSTSVLTANELPRNRR